MQRTENRGQRTAKKNGGFTLIETIITLVVLSIAAVGVLSVFTMGIKGSASPVIVEQAMQLAQERMDTVTALKSSASFTAVQDIGSTSCGAPFANFFSSVDVACVDANLANAQVVPATGYNADGTCDQTGFTRHYKQAAATVSWASGTVTLTTIVGDY